MSELAHTKWHPIETAPFNKDLRIMVEDGSEWSARLIPDGSLDERLRPCDQWVAVNDGEHPPCWSEGACWENNADECRSLQPTAWRYPSPDKAGRAP